ncbi:MAG TPA: ectonucleotide pyrophosphatase/phosphodiesterase [Lacunisphaera sp.]|nr:ectonucleotide pyrophosphatase/phosphodiesterase [Lacunisphaera sp.]
MQSLHRSWPWPFLVVCAVAPLWLRAATVPPLLLISMDGFRWNYCAQHPAETPHLRQLIAEGGTARGLIPVFPSNTFADHYSIVTGLYPAHHGIINNDMFDPGRGLFFHYKLPASNRDPLWWGGEPIWNTAVKQGRPSACAFWPGSEVEIGGARPTFWKPYDYSIPFENRLAELSGWMRLPAGQRPAVIAFYLEEANSVGHKFGAESPELAATVKLLDERVGRIMARLTADGVEANIVIVSDHGMTAVSPDRVIVLDDLLDLAAVQVDFDGSVVGLRPLDGDVGALLRSLERLPQHAKAYRAEDLPARFHLAGNARIPPVWILPEEGWEVERRAEFARTRDTFKRGDHGYDPALPSMHGILIVHGPSFKAGVVVDSVENVHVYNLMCAALHLVPAPNDGDDRLVRAFLR